MTVNRTGLSLDQDQLTVLVAMLSQLQGDGSGSMPIALPGTAESDIAAIKAAVEIIDNAISGSEMQVDIVASIPAGTSIIGKVGIDQTTDETTNKVRCFPGTSTLWDISDRATRDLGKADIAGIDAIGSAAGQATMANSLPVVFASDQSNLPIISSTTTKTAVIASAASLSGEVNIEGYSKVAIMMPAAWTAADLTFQASNESGGTFYDLYGSDGVEVIINAAAQRIIPIDIYSSSLAPLSYIKFRSGTTGTPVAQAAERTIIIILKN